jgi:hypothetical protein
VAAKTLSENLLFDNYTGGLKGEMKKTMVFSHGFFVSNGNLLLIC